MIKDSVQIPSWVNSGNDKYVTRIAEGIASGRIEMYAEEKVGKSTVGFRRVRLYDDIIEEREETNDEYKETIQKYKTAKKHLNLIKMLKLNSEKKQLKRMLDSLEKESSYISYITDSDEEPSFILCKEDLAQTARDIKPFKM